MRKGTNIYKFILLRFLLAVALLLLSQVLFYFFNTRIFHIAGSAEAWGIVWGNVRFGVATMALVLMPFVVLYLLPFRYRWNAQFRRWTDVLLYYVPVIAVIAANTIDTVYYQFTYRRMTAEVFSYVGVGGKMSTLIPLFVSDYWYGFVTFGLEVALFCFLARRIRLATMDDHYFWRLSDLIISFVSLCLMVLMVRGGVQRHFLPLTDAARYCQAKNMSLVNNSGYNILRTIGAAEDDCLPTMDEACHQLPQHLPQHLPMAVQSDTLPYRNVMIIILESFSQEYMGCYNKELEQSFTPFLDSLSQYCRVYQGRSNGKESVEGVAAVLSGIPSLTDTPFILSTYGKTTDTLMSLPLLFQRHGFSTSFFHGSYRGVLGFDRFCQKMNVDAYYGLEEYMDSKQSKPSDFDNAWGIYDEPYLQYVARQIDTLRKPFFAALFTLSSHHPYGLPRDVKDAFPEGNHPLLRTVAYSDHALREFFATAKKKTWYDNTLFVITGDHPGQGLTPQYNDYDGWYNVPMLFFCPSDSVAFVSPRVMQQIDVMPTLCDMFHLQDTFPCLGVSALQRPDAGWQIVYGSGYHMLLSQDARDPSQHSVATISGTNVEGAERDVKRLRSILQYYYDMFYFVQKDSIPQR